MTEFTRIQALSKVSIALSTTLRLDEVLYKAIVECIETLNFDAAVIYLLDENKEYFIAQHFYGIPTETVKHMKKLPTDSIGGVVAASGKTVVTEDLGQYYHQRPQLEGFKSLMSVPIQVKKKTIGVLDVFTKEYRVFEPEDISLIESIGLQIGVASENAKTFLELEESRQLNADLLAMQVDMQERERQRIAQEIHDSLNQSMVGLYFHLQYCRDEIDRSPDHVLAVLDKLLSMTKENIQEIRQIIYDLHPVALEKYGFLGAVEELISRYSQQGLMEIDLYIQGNPSRYHAKAEIYLYRVIQEAINNIYKHAHTKQASVSMYFESTEVRILIEDQGIGFDLTHKLKNREAYGLLGMKRRIDDLNGRLTITSQPAKGTWIEVLLDGEHHLRKDRDPQDD
ncbi:GAF domain-containing sensor histidine kinase [Ammoniphilus sp. CFH 90114]|uniref:GAF domain-containing sensor histidine kinase n=1 Tax=Ammoniphilus sp. CFH 90114 TaxID=2493665 RepID=UPI00100EAB6D|nr:GAF domain-containing sensor histidine kinase [Ammoniphilus sp. CFH 90114]RXT07070.1 GAF domain-containing protein [Ammoniphilus sp. CFH 90114]